MATKDELIAAARERVKDLWVSYIDAKPENFDFSASRWDGDGEPGWDYLEAAECDDCGCYVVEGDDHGFISPDGEQVPRQVLLASGDIDEEDLYEWAEGAGFHLCPRHGDDFREFDSAEGPMMNYRYPIDDSHYTADNARKIADLPLCLVQTELGDAYLALTGGGMDLSWEICEAYVRLGYLPPSHFELPGMADKRLNERTALVVASAERSNEILSGWATSRLERARQMYDRLVIDNEENT